MKSKHGKPSHDGQNDITEADAGRPYLRESNETPMLDALIFVAASVRFSDRATLRTGVFCRASVFSSRMSSLVHSRRFDFFLAIWPLPRVSLSRTLRPLCGRFYCLIARGRHYRLLAFRFTIRLLLSSDRLAYLLFPSARSLAFLSSNCPALLLSCIAYLPLLPGSHLLPLSSCLSSRLID